MSLFADSKPSHAATNAAELEKQQHENYVQVGIYAASGAVGIGAAVNSIRHKFYDEMKVIGPFKKLHDKHKKKIHAQELKPNQTAAQLQREIGKLEVDYTRDFQKMVLEKRGIHSTGWDGWVEGTYRRWQALGPHTRAEVIFNVATAAVITIGTLFTLKQSKSLSDALNDHEQSKAQGR